MDLSTVREFRDDAIANNCLRASRCRNIGLRQRLPAYFRPLLKQKKPQIVS